MSEAKYPKVMIIPVEAAKIAPADAYASSLRDAVYCRVSTNSDEQQSSYQAHMEYYQNKVKNNPQWILVGIYAD